MLNIKKVLVPLDFPNPPLRVLFQAAMLGAHFHSEILLLHVLTPQSIAAGVPTDPSEFAHWDLIAHIKSAAEGDWGNRLHHAFDGLSVRTILAHGEAGPAILIEVIRESVDIVVMPSFGQTFSEFLLGSVTAKVLDGAGCPVWTDAHVKGLPPDGTQIRNVLCAVDFNQQNKSAVSYAQELAASFNARLTLAHVTPSVEFWGPGGDYVDESWKKTIVGTASEHLSDLARELGTNPGTYIGSGEVPKVLSAAAKETNADLLVTGSRPFGGHLRTHGYAIISAVPVPVLSV